METTNKYAGTMFSHCDTTGLTFSAYVTEMRMEEAVKMLTSTDITVEEVFYACGYNTKSTFYRAFTKKYGCTPKEYRKNRTIGR